MRTDRFLRKLLITVLLTIRFPGLRSQPLIILCLDLLFAIKEALDRTGTHLRRLFVIDVEHRFDRPQDDMQGYAAILPGLDHRPIQRAKKQVLGSPANERFLDLRKIIKVVNLETESRMLEDWRKIVKKRRSWETALPTEG